VAVDAEKFCEGLIAGLIGELDDGTGSIGLSAVNVESVRFVAKLFPEVEFKG
jgi:hypothetical protein